MALIVKDRVRETSATTGTGTLTLSGAVSGFQSFSAIGNANETYYTIVNAATGDWEVGIGTYTASGTTLSRNQVLESSNGGALVNFGAGTKDVFGTYPADRSVSQADIGTAPNEIPLNQYLGSLAYQDLESVTIDGGVATLDTATITSIQNDTTISNVEPSLMLNFAAVKKLDPRITFSRPTDAVYYDGQTVTKAEENLLVRSQEFDNASWLKTSATVTANTAVAPDGTTTAETLTASATTSQHNVYQLFTTLSGTSVVSVFVKADTYNYVQISSSPTVNYFANFDVTSGAGVVGTKGSSAVSSSIINAGNGWYRCVVEMSGVPNIRIALVSSASAAYNETWTAAGTETVFIWGAQLEQRSAVSSYTPTTTQPITLYQPTLLTAPSGVARFDHNPTTTESLGLLIEEQRTNLQTYSEDFSNAVYVATNSTLTPNQVVAPDGMLTGYKLTETATTGEHYFQRPSVRPAITSGTVYTFSWYAKKAGRAKIRVSSFAFNNLQIFYDLETGVSTYVSGGTSYSFGMQDVGDGWWRCFATSTANQPQHSIVFALVSTGTTVNYTGNGYSGIFIWGAQLEAGSVPTSYIPTVASQVTRSADSASMTGANFSSFYNQATGSLYVECNNSGNSGLAVEFFQTTSVSNRWYTYGNNGSNKAQFVMRPLGSVQADINDSGISNPPNTMTKIIVAYAVNDFAISQNGRSPITDTSGYVTNNLDQLRIGNTSAGNASLNGRIKKLSYYPARLSNEELQEMTS